MAKHLLLQETQYRVVGTDARNRHHVSWYDTAQAAVEEACAYVTATIIRPDGSVMAGVHARDTSRLERMMHEAVFLLDAVAEQGVGTRENALAVRAAGALDALEEAEDVCPTCRRSG